MSDISQVDTPLFNPVIDAPVFMQKIFRKLCSTCCSLQS